MNARLVLASITVALVLAVLAVSLGEPFTVRTQEEGIPITEPNLSGPTVQKEDADPDPHEYCGIANFGWSRQGFLARGEQAYPDSIRCLREAGFGAVVNLRSEPVEYDEKGFVEELGMQYLNLQIADDTAPSPDQVTEFLAFVDQQSREGRAAYIHCAGGRGRAGVMEGIYLLWQGWPTQDVFERYVHFGAKVDKENGGNGQVQVLHEIGLLLGRGDSWPQTSYLFGNRVEDWKRPDYMAGWDYAQVQFPPK